MAKILASLPVELQMLVLERLEWPDLVNLSQVLPQLVPAMRLSRRKYLSTFLMCSPTEADLTLMEVVAARQHCRHILSVPDFLLHSPSLSTLEIIRRYFDPQDGYTVQQRADLLYFVNTNHIIFCHAANTTTRRGGSCCDDVFRHVNIPAFAFFFLLRPVIAQLNECSFKEEERRVIENYTRHLPQRSLCETLFDSHNQSRILRQIDYIIQHTDTMLDLTDVCELLDSYALLDLIEILEKFYQTGIVTSYGMAGDLLNVLLGLQQRADPNSNDVMSDSYLEIFVTTNDSIKYRRIQYCLMNWSKWRYGTQNFSSGPICVNLLYCFADETSRGSLIASYLRQYGRTLLESALVGVVVQTGLNRASMTIKHTYFGHGFTRDIDYPTDEEAWPYAQLGFLRSQINKLTYMQSPTCRLLRNSLGLDSPHMDALTLYDYLNPNKFRNRTDPTFEPEAYLLHETINEEERRILATVYDDDERGTTSGAVSAH